MCLIFSFIPGTAWLVIAFFVLFASTKAEGSIRTFGRVLGAWAVVVALMFPIMGAYMTLSGLCPMRSMMESMMSSGTG